MDSEKQDRPFSHHIIENDPGQKNALKTFIKINLLITILITLTIWAVLGIFWGEYMPYFQLTLRALTYRAQVLTGGMPHYRNIDSRNETHLHTRFETGIHNMNGWIVVSIIYAPRTVPITH